MQLILASSSPRRRELLCRAGFDLEVQPSRVEEVRRAGENAEEFARRVACEKALDVAASVPVGGLVLGADTVVVVNAEILGKPANPEDAARMLRMLSGVTHQVLSAVCLVTAPDRIVALRHETTLVTFRKLQEQEIQDYVSSGEPSDKAGAYAVQGLASKFISRIEGDSSNVVGLPVALVSELLGPYMADL